jgi:hypothetical protein
VVGQRKLTPGEITASVEKIRKRYDEYVAKYFKPRGLRGAFEDRYIRALRGGVDVSSFLLAEISAIEELIGREEKRIADIPVKPLAEPGPGFADRVLEENQKRISKYPEVPFHSDASEEVRRLLGALAGMHLDRWQQLGHVLQDTMYPMSSPEMLRLDTQLRALAASDHDSVPQLLLDLVNQLRKFPRNFAAVEREEREFVLAAAFFLNDLFTAMDRVKRVYTEMGDEDRRFLDETLAHIWGIINDFRLKDLRRSGRQEPR